MYLKKGSILNESETKNPILKSPDGETFEVSHVVAFIWNKLDGQTETPEVIEYIKEKGGVDHPKLNKIVGEIMMDLEKAGLIQDIQPTVS